MGKLREWRGHNLTKRYEKIERTFNLQALRTAEDFPIVINAPCYFGYGDNTRTPDYFENPVAMVKFQEEGFEKHLKNVADDTIPYFMPWFGTGVLASAFGCELRPAKGYGDDPSVVSHCIENVKDIVHLKTPDPYKDGLMPRVLDSIDYARTNSDLPVGLTDMNSPLCTVAQMCGYENMFIWMYEEPKAMHELFQIVTDCFINWTKVQKKHIGEPLYCSNGLQGVWSPKGVGIWMSDDDIVSMSPNLYEEFIVPQYSRIFETFGGGSLHFCGNAAHQISNIIKIRGLRVVNNSTLMDLEGFGKIAGLPDRNFVIQIQDMAYIDIKNYATAVLNKIADLKGTMIATFVLEHLAMEKGGNNIISDRTAFDTANQIVTVVREYISGRLTAAES